VVGSLDAAPGESNVARFKLPKPGRYGMACFKRHGTTSREQRRGGRRHVELGMLTELSVEAA
jgi:hypothetical protein